MKKFELPEKPKKTNTSEDFNNLRKAVDELDKFDYAWKTHANKADRRINAANKYIEELERENQRLRVESLAVKTPMEDAKKQQPELPEFVAEWIEILKTKGLKPLKNPETYGETGFTEEKLQNIVFWISENQEDYMRAWLDGYTVAKEKRFYLKNKLTGQRLIRLLEENGGGFLECVTSTDKERMQFTQSEIDSMETGSYELVPVEDGE